tara:strand:+ start:849 stop:1100 length:252 start_codon:yes stop_codon:yes gene_type:complete
MTLKEDTKLVNLKQIAEYLGVSVATVRRMVKRDDLPYIVLGGSYMFTIDSVRDSIVGDTFSKQPTMSAKKVARPSSQKSDDVA